MLYIANNYPVKDNFPPKLIYTFFVLKNTHVFTIILFMISKLRLCVFVVVEGNLDAKGDAED